MAYTLLKRKIGASFLALLNDMDVLRLERADFKYARAVQYFNGPGVCCLVSSSKRDAFDISPPSGAFSILSRASSALYDCGPGVDLPPLSSTNLCAFGIIPPVPLLRSLSREFSARYVCGPGAGAVRSTSTKRAALGITPPGDLELVRGLSPLPRREFLSIGLGVLALRALRLELLLCVGILRDCLLQLLLRIFGPFASSPNARVLRRLRPFSALFSSESIWISTVVRCCSCMI